MTSLLTPRTSSRPVDVGRPRQRPLVLLGIVAGAGAVLLPLALLIGAAMVGWFVSDAGVHGQPRDGMRVGALAWLLGHGSGVWVNGTAITLLPLGLTLITGWVIWRVAHRLGESVAGYGPDLDRLSDGERDLTVPFATTSFAATYLIVLIAVHTLSAGAAAPSLGRALLGGLALAAGLGGLAIATGSGRLAVRAARLPVEARHAVGAAARILLWFLSVSAVLVLVGLLADLSTATDALAQLDLSAGESAIFLAANAVLLPTATIWAGSWLLGPGFSVGAGTLVAPSGVLLGPLPLTPLAAALPEQGLGSGSWPWLLLLPGLVAAAAVVATQRRFPTLRWDVGALRGCAGGMLAGLFFVLLTLLASGAAGPGRLRHVGPAVVTTGWYGLVVFGVGGLLGGLGATWWQRRTSVAVTGSGADEG